MGPGSPESLNADDMTRHSPSHDMLLIVESISNSNKHITDLLAPHNRLQDFSRGGSNMGLCDRVSHFPKPRPGDLRPGNYSIIRQGAESEV